MKAEKRTFLILNWLEMPDNIKDIVSEWNGFSNDSLIKLLSEFSIEDFKNGMKCIEEYMEDQIENNGFVGNLEKFIKEYGLEFEVWFIEQKFDLKGVDDILINICW